MSLSRPLLLGLVIFVAFALLYPNSFGNNPDLIQDESYFLTSSLSAIQKVTLPGWEFSASGAYYGGVQTYLDTLALVPVVGAIALASHFSLVETEIRIALHTGDLLQVLRLVNGFLVLGFIAFCVLYLVRRRIPRALGLNLLLLLFLLLGNSLLLGLIHTAKVWPLAFLLDAAVGTLFLTNEYYLAQKGRSFISRGCYAALLIWAAVLAFFQNFIGVYSVGLWAAYALLLEHVSLRDIGEYLRRRWYLLVLFSLTQISFLYRGLIARAHPSLLDPAGNSTRTASAAIDWVHRLSDPVVYALQSQPLILLYTVGVALLLWRLSRGGFASAESRTRRYWIIAGIHPILVFLFYYGLIGFSLFPRYSVPLAAACSFSAVLLLGASRWACTIALVASGFFFFAVGTQAITLYWWPSSAVLLRETIARVYNSSSNIFLIEPSAARLSLPLNTSSLGELDDRRRNQTRFVFLRQHLDLVAREISFKPLVLFADTPREESALLAGLASSTSAVWAITQDCSRLCSAAEAARGSCLAVNPAACGIFSPEDQKEYPAVLLRPYLEQTGLGITYIARRVQE
ncbi:hypothetical protein HY091_01215 [Candidatus Kaiserbacteria bacterium]|nr:hypothetical protein [Candidatus Kaiserbacteria bacterium]